MNCIRMGTHTLESFTEGRHRGAASTCGSTGSHMKASGTKGGSTGMGCGRALKVIHMLGNGKTALRMGSGLKSLLMAIDMKESGSIQLSMGRAQRCITTETCMLGTTKMVTQTVSVSTSGQTRASSRGPSLTGKNKVKENGLNMLSRSTQSLGSNSFSNTNTWETT